MENSTEPVGTLRRKTLVLEIIGLFKNDPIVFPVLLESPLPEELVELRELSEVGYCQNAVRKITDTAWIAIQEAQERHDAYLAEDYHDGDELERLDLSFHYALLDTTHNPLILKIGSAVEQLFHAPIRETLLTIHGRSTATKQIS